MRSKLLRALLLGMSIALCIAPLATAAQDEWQLAKKTRPGLTLPMVKLKCDMQRLWLEHGSWTHRYIVSALAGLDDKDKVLARLLRNQQDIGNAIKPYYGEEAGNKYASLLTEHIVLAGKIVDALKSGNQVDAEKINKDWHKNADDIARYLSGLNPNWSYQDLKAIWDRHLELITEQLKARLAKDWEADIVAFDKGQDHLVKYANTLSTGIVKQFPNKFQ